MATPVMKRLMREAQQMAKKPVREYHAYPTEGNLLEWHFTLRGPADSPYSEGFYHGRVLVPPNYPFAPPDVVLITPNGRFELEKRICLSISSYHPENWQSTWGIATVLTALRDFMLTPGNNGIGAVEYPKEVREQLAARSRTFKCKDCGQTIDEHIQAMESAPSVAEIDASVTQTPQTGSKTPAPVGDTPVQPSPLNAGQPEASPAAADRPVKFDLGDDGAATANEEDTTMEGFRETSIVTPQTSTNYAAGAAITDVTDKLEAAVREPEAAPVRPAAPAAAPPAVAQAGAPAGVARAPLVVPPPPVDAPAPARNVQIRRRGAGGVEVRITAPTLDKVVFALAAVMALVIIKKLTFDAPRPNTSTGRLVRLVWGSYISPLFFGLGGGVENDLDWGEF